MKGISDSLLPQLSEVITRRMGLRFPQGSRRRLEQGIRSAARNFGFAEPDSCVQWLLSTDLTKTQVEILASHLTVGETYFFREKPTFDALEEHVLPELISLRRQTDRYLRIWSAGCCTGEEPYSLAILLSRMLPDIADWKITILATDINPDSLRKAAAGLYGKWSFRNCPEWVQANYFVKAGDGHFQILPGIGKMVTFDYQNLIEDPYPSLSNNTNAMDIIFCRNVLMYFPAETGQKVTMNLYRSLVDNGWLIINATESSYVQTPPFGVVSFPHAIFYSKDGREPAREQHIWKPCYPGKTDEAPLRPPAYLAPTPIPALPPLPGQTAHAPVIKQEVPKEPLPSYAATLALYEQGKYTDATEMLLQLVSEGKDSSKAIVLLARVHANQGKLAEALYWCDQALALDRLVPGLHYLRATILQEQGLIEEAARSLKGAIYLDPDFVLAHFAMGIHCRHQGKSGEAAKHLGNTLKLLGNYQPQEILPESDGTTAGRLIEIIGLLAEGRPKACVK